MDTKGDPFIQYRTLASEAAIGSATVDAACYSSAEVYADEREKIFRRAWLMIGRESEVPNPGDFVRRSIYPLDADALIVRGRDGAIRAFHNACPHRGAELVREDHGHASLFTCPYHAWSFGTDGVCKAINGAQYFSHVDRTQTGLSPIHCATWNGFIFLNFDETPRQTLKEYLGGLGDWLGQLPVEGFELCVEIAMEADANWKLFFETTVESYHVPALHRKTLPAFSRGDNPFGLYFDAHFWPPHSAHLIQGNPAWVPQSDVLKFVAAETGASQLRITDVPKGQDAPARLSESAGINMLGIPDFFVRTFFFFPCTQLLVLDHGFVITHVWPLGPDKTRFVHRSWFRKAPASYLEEFGQAHMAASNRDLFTEDALVAERQHRALKCGALKQVHLGENELLLRHLHDMVGKWLDDGRSGA